MWTKLWGNVPGLIKILLVVLLSNLIPVQVSEDLPLGDNASINKPPKWEYTNGYLKDLGERCRHTVKLNTRALLTVRRLRLDKHKRLRRRGKRGGKSQRLKNIENDMDMARSIMAGNLIYPQMTHTDKNQTLRMICANVLSIRRRDHEIRHIMEFHKCQIAVITETWQLDSDIHWLNSNPLNQDGMTIYNVNRPREYRGGGLALITTNDFKVDLNSTTSR